MHWIDWIIIFVSLVFVMWMGWYSRRFITGVSDYLVAGRVCRRYVITTANLANALGLVTLAASVEVSYMTGFAMQFWNNILLPLSIIISMTGYCMYRFRETRAMSIGQFLEIRYHRPLRIFASFLRSIAEIMANVIMPSLAARFFIYYLGLPERVSILGFRFPTFLIITGITLTLAISLIYFGGTLSIVVTDTIQGIFFYPVLLVFIIYILTKFSWSTEVVEVMSDRVPGESFINPFDISGLRNFNLFMLCTLVLSNLLHTAAGVTGNNSSAITPHEAKMGNILGAWRGGFSCIFFGIFAIAIITLMNHANYANDAREIRLDVSEKVMQEIEPSAPRRKAIMEELKSIPPLKHTKGIDKPFSQTDNPDTAFFQVTEKGFGISGEGSSKSQQFRTIFRQLLLPATMRHMLPAGLSGLFCTMILLFILSTDDGRIYSASSTIVQDCIIPFYKSGKLSPEKHIRYLKLVTIGVGIFFFLGSYFMKQIDFINLFINIMYGMWMGGCGPMLVFGFYSRFGTTAGAWASLLSGMTINISGVILQRTWAATVYPFLEYHGLVEPVGNFLAAVSRPFHPYIVWEINRLKFPVNSYEIFFIAMIVSLVMYVIVSKLTCKEPFNLDRMLHRGIYAIEGEKNIKAKWTLRTVFSNLIGITPEYSKSDKVIAWSVFFYTIVYNFGIAFLAVVIWNCFAPWKIEWWGRYFLITMLIVPAIGTLVNTVWFGIGSIHDLFAMFKTLRERVANPLDNGMVEGHVSISEKDELMRREKSSDIK